MPGSPKRFRWVYFLPLLHLCACLTTAIALFVPGLQFLGISWSFIMLADLPVSLLAYVVGWKYPALADLWIIVVGTLWWYLLSRGVELLFDKFKDRGPDVQTIIPKGDVGASGRARD